MTLFKPGHLLHYPAENKKFLVVLAGKEGVRYLDPMNMQVDDYGRIQTQYVTHDELMNMSEDLPYLDDINKLNDRVSDILSEIVNVFS